MAQTVSQPAVYANGLMKGSRLKMDKYMEFVCVL